ncbi:16S rRNA processing protein RimM [Listeria monocytogenes]|nr:16S rRNA processing protein RimM [Listeria monocytogenes]
MISFSGFLLFFSNKYTVFPTWNRSSGKSVVAITRISPIKP